MEDESNIGIENAAIESSQPEQVSDVTENAQQPIDVNKWQEVLSQKEFQSFKGDPLKFVKSYKDMRNEYSRFKPDYEKTKSRLSEYEKKIKEYESPERPENAVYQRLVGLLSSKDEAVRNRAQEIINALDALESGGENQQIPDYLKKMMEEHKQLKSYVETQRTAEEEKAFQSEVKTIESQYKNVIKEFDDFTNKWNIDYDKASMIEEVQALRVSPEAMRFYLKGKCSEALLEKSVSEINKLKATINNLKGNKSGWIPAGVNGGNSRKDVSFDEAILKVLNK